MEIKQTNFNETISSHERRMIAIAKQCPSMNHLTLLEYVAIHCICKFLTLALAEIPALRSVLDGGVIIRWGLKLIVRWSSWFYFGSGGSKIRNSWEIISYAKGSHVKRYLKTSHPPCHPDHKQTSNYAGVCDVDQFEIRIMKGSTGVMPPGKNVQILWVSNGDAKVDDWGSVRCRLVATLQWHRNTKLNTEITRELE